MRYTSPSISHILALTKMKGYVVVLSLILLVASQLAYSRTIKDDLNLPSDEREEYSGSSRSFVAASTVTCEPPYGILPCSDNVWGQLFLIVVYGILLSIGGQYASNGSDLFFQIIGPGFVGGSVFQFLGTIIQLIIMLGKNNFPMFNFFLSIISFM